MKKVPYPWVVWIVEMDVERIRNLPPASAEDKIDEAYFCHLSRWLKSALLS